ncbi:MAG: lipoyl synthase [Actinomycetota bacterium]
MPSLHVRWLGTVPYGEALDLQRSLHGGSPIDHLLLLEHPHVYTLGVRADTANILVPPHEVGAELVRADRGGDVTYHGPGQLVGYPILTLPGKRGGGMADTVAYVTAVEELLIETLADLGLPGAGRLDHYPGVWLDPDGDRPRKIAAIGVRLTRGRTMHGFALNVDPDLGMFGNIVPCGIPDKPVTSLVAEGVDVELRDVVDAISARAGETWGGGVIERHDVVWRTSAADLSPFSRGQGSGEPVRPERGGRADTGGNVRLVGRLAQAGVTEGLQISTRKPDWLRVKADMGPEYLQLKRVMRDLDLRTVCEEASCPNIFECWADGTATFMINGERCTRACGFCDVDTRKPEPLDTDEPARVADAVDRMGLAHAVVTAVARDDLPDGGASAFADTIEAIRLRTPATKVEVLIPDFKGDADQLGIVLDARPDVLNHNVETVPRLQRAVRPSAGYARSLTVLARAKAAGLTTKTSIIVGMGETDDEIVATLHDLRGVSCDIVTIGQYLRPTTNHLPVHRWVEPETFEQYRAIGMDDLGIPHVESSPLTRSSYHAREAAERAQPVRSAMG